MTDTQEQGLVLKNYGGFYYVQDSRQSVYECRVRGKVKEKILSGDRVSFTPLEIGQGILEKVLPRKNQLQRPQVANVTLMMIVMACDQPRPDLFLLDRLLFIAEFNKISPCVVLNKCDLKAASQAENIMAYYPHCFPVVQTSARQNVGMDSLTDIVAGEIAVLAGPSGTGKTSLLKSLTGRLEVRTQEVSSRIGRGKHTTRHVELYPLLRGGWVVDTPGFGVLDLPAMKREELAQYFPDFDQYSTGCKFDNCLHFKEKECGIQDAVREGKILSSRYLNYISMLEEAIAKERCY